MGNKIDVQLTDITGFTKKLGTLKELRDFMKREATFWKKRYDVLAENNTRRYHNFFGYFSNFQTALSQIGSWEEGDLLAWSSEMLQQNVIQVQRQCLRDAPSAWLYSGHRFTSIYVDCYNHEHGYDAADAFIKFVTTPQIANLNSIGAFLGTMRAYEFLNQDSELVKRRTAERRSLAQLHRRLEESYSDLFNDVEAFKDSFTEWDNRIRKEWTKRSNTAFKDHEDLLNSHQANFDSRSEEWQQHISGLEKTYEEQLRLSMPAKYWKEASSRFRSQGRFAIGALVTTVAAGVGLFSWLYTKWLGGESGPLGVESTLMLQKSGAD